MRPSIVRRETLILAIVCWLPVLAPAQPVGVTPAGAAVNANALTCMPLAAVDNARTPPQLYAAVTDCVRRDRYPDGVALFALAGLYSRYDAARVADKTAGQAGQVLILGMFSSLPPESAQKFRDAAGALAKDAPALERVCSAVQRVGPPGYYPAYMVAHGMAAITGALSGTQPPATLDPSFDGAATWMSLRTSYLNCPAGRSAGAAGAAATPKQSAAFLAGASSVVPVANASGAGIDESEEAQARCHPHLQRSIASTPQIDISGLADPSIGHIKIHFWVNGGGYVTRGNVTAASFGTAAEQQAQLSYIRTLTFSVPGTLECRDREMELIGDVFVNRGSAGQWQTFVRLYPRNVFVAAGVLRRAD